VAEVADGSDAACAQLTAVAGLGIAAAVPVYCYVAEDQATEAWPGLQRCGARVVTALLADLVGALEHHEAEALAQVMLDLLRASTRLVSVERGDDVTAVVTTVSGQRVGVAIVAWLERPSNRVYQDTVELLARACKRDHLDACWLVLRSAAPDPVLRELATLHDVQLLTFDELRRRLGLL
jgi:hypothetical protein